MTPAPWTLKQHATNHQTLTGATAGLIADIHKDEDARLLAAAPELLACLCEMLGAAEMDCMDDKSNVWRNLMNNAQVAIAKATGAQA